MKKIVLFSLLLLSFAITATAQVTEHTYKTIDLQNYGTVSIGTIIDLTKNEYMKDDNMKTFVVPSWNEKGYLTETEYVWLRSFVNESKILNRIIATQPTKMSLNDIMYDNTLYQEKLSKSVKTIAVCTTITTTTVLAGIIGGIIYAISKK
jgi:hypothetical protein